MKKEIQKKDDTKIYYDVIISNTNINGMNASFNASFDSIFIKNVSEYKLCVQKMMLDSEILPISICEIRNPQAADMSAGDFVSVYNVYMTYTTALGVTNYYTSPILWNPDRIPANVPNQYANGVPFSYDNKDRYFFIYSYYHFIKLINDALSSCTTLLNAAEGVALDPPYFYFNSQTNLIEFYTEITNYNIDITNINTACVFFNKELYKYVGEGFRCILYNADVNITENYYMIPFINNDDINSYIKYPHVAGVLDDNTPTIIYIKTIQEYISLSSWNIVSNILITTNDSPINQEFYPIRNNNNNPNLYDNVSNDFNRTQSYPILTTFTPLLNTNENLRSSIVFTRDNINEGDCVNFIGNGSLNKLNLEVKFTDKYNNLYNFNISKGKQIFIRLCFIKL